MNSLRVGAKSHTVQTYFSANEGRGGGTGSQMFGTHRRFDGTGDFRKDATREPEILRYAGYLESMGNRSFQILRTCTFEDYISFLLSMERVFKEIGLY